MEATQKKDKIQYRGRLTIELHDKHGKLKRRIVTHNLVTEQGDFFSAAAGYQAAWTGWGMKLGTATTSASKTGAGSYIAAGDYVSGSAQALDDSTPKAGATNDIIQFRRQWAAGQGTNGNINRVAIVDNTTDAGEADATGTYAISVFSAAIDKGASDVLTVTWDVTHLGA